MNGSCGPGYARWGSRADTRSHRARGSSVGPIANDEVLDLALAFARGPQQPILAAHGGVPCGFLGLVERDERHVDDVVVER